MTCMEIHSLLWKNVDIILTFPNFGLCLDRYTLSYFCFLWFFRSKRILLKQENVRRLIPSTGITGKMTMMATPPGDLVVGAGLEASETWILQEPDLFSRSCRILLWIDLMHSEQPKLRRVLAVLSATGSNMLTVWAQKLTAGLSNRNRRQLNLCLQNLKKCFNQAVNYWEFKCLRAE